MISALCINVGKGETKVSEGERSHKIEEFVQQVAAKYKPDVVFSQDAFANKNLEKLIPALSNNIEGSSFVLKKNVINENSGDRVGIFLNESNFTIENIDKECMKVLQNLRLEKNDFFDEDKRAIFVLGKTKSGGQRFLFSSFHAKKNKITDVKREIHIIEFFSYLDMIAKRVKADHILVGSDTNHKMRSFESRNKKKEFCVKVLLYDYPVYCERSINKRHVYDFFMISQNLTPTTTDPKVFNVETNYVDTVDTIDLISIGTDYLDHHPLFMQFTYPVQPKDINVSRSNNAKLTNLSQSFQTNQRPEDVNCVKTNSFGDSFNSVQHPIQSIPPPSSQYPPPSSQNPPPSSQYPVPSSKNPPPSTQYPPPSAYYPLTSSLYPSPSSPFPEQSRQYPTPSSKYSPQSNQYPSPLSKYLYPSSHYVSPSSQCLAPSSQYLAPSSQYLAPSSQYHTLASNSQVNQHINLKPVTKKGSQANQLTSSPSQYQIKQTELPNSFKPAKTTTNSIVRFNCELCLTSFETKQGLLIHFGQKRASHFPCKEKFSEEQDPNKSICLRVFKTEGALKSHKTKQKNNPRHHHPTIPFPNLF